MMYIYAVNNCIIILTLQLQGNVFLFKITRTNIYFMYVNQKKENSWYYIHLSKLIE